MNGVAVATEYDDSTTSVASTRVALTAWMGVVTAGALVAIALNAAGQRISIAAPPLHARLDAVVGAGAVPVVVVGALAVHFGPRIASTLRWRRLLFATVGGSVLWSLSLACVRGVGRIVSPVRGPREYLAAVPQVNDLGAFLGGFVEHIRAYPVHVQGHPPGTVLLLAALRDIGLDGAWWAAGLFVAGGAAAVPAVLLATREVAGEELARRAAPFLVVAPTAIWLTTSADALYAGLSAWGAALVIVGTGRRDGRGDLAAAAGGLLLGVSAFGSYGLVLVALVPIAVAVSRRRIRPLALAAAASTVVVYVFAAAGFSWISGLAATQARYAAGIAASRPYLAFVVVNMAALAVAVGAATAVAFARLRDRRLWLLVAAALMAVAIADLSGMSKGEVERIWLPFTPWLLVGCAALAPSARAGAPRWLVVQVATAIAIESLVLTPW